ncbi:hypothetical protein JHK84_031358 [Glycine max]|nr:hypothetical protein JHK84_031358 [Glycine max]
MLVGIDGSEVPTTLEITNCPLRSELHRRRILATPIPPAQILPHLICCDSSCHRSSSGDSHSNNNNNDYFKASHLLLGDSLSRQFSTNCRCLTPLIWKNNLLFASFHKELLITRTLLNRLQSEMFRRSPNLSHKNDDLGLIHRWIVVKFKQHVCNPFPRILTVGNFDIMSDLREIPLGTKGIIPNRKGNAWQIANLGDH